MHIFYQEVIIFLANSESRGKNGVFQDTLHKNIQRFKVAVSLTYGFTCIMIPLIYIQSCETHYLAPILPICHEVEGLEGKYTDPNQTLFMSVFLIGMQFIITAILFSTAYMYFVITTTMGIYGMAIGLELW